jgi:hypothetical protein
VLRRSRCLGDSTTSHPPLSNIARNAGSSATLSSGAARKELVSPQALALAPERPAAPLTALLLPPWQL